jgi:hypothetical protein
MKFHTFIYFRGGGGGGIDREASEGKRTTKQKKLHELGFKMYNFIKKD